MLQVTYGLTCMNRASAFRLHKRFGNDRESEKIGTKKDVRPSELVEKISRFLDEGNKNISG